MNNISKLIVKCEKQKWDSTALLDEDIDAIIDILHRVKILSKSAISIEDYLDEVKEHCLKNEANWSERVCRHVANTYLKGE